MTETLAVLIDYTFLTGKSIGSDSFFTVFLYNVFIFSNFCRIFWVPEVYVWYILLQTVLFLTDSVFYVLFAYFDESMSSIGGYEPYRSWNTVGLTPI